MSLLIICPEELAESANHLARAVGNDGDEKTFSAKWSKKDGLFSFTKYYRVCNFGVVPERLQKWLMDPSLAAELPATVDREKCLDALDGLGTQIQVVFHKGNAVQKLTDLGYKVVEETENGI